MVTIARIVVRIRRGGGLLRKGVAMDMSNWFCLVIDMAGEIEELNDWTEDGLRRYWTAVRAAVCLDLLTTRCFPYKGFQRHSEDFVRWAVLWLSDPNGKAVPHV